MTEQKRAFLAVLLTVLVLMLLQGAFTTVLSMLCLIAILYKVICTYKLVERSHQVFQTINRRTRASNYYYQPRASPPPRESVITPPRGEDATLPVYGKSWTPPQVGYEQFENGEGMLLVQPMSIPPQ